MMPPDFGKSKQLSFFRQTAKWFKFTAAGARAVGRDVGHEETLQANEPQLAR